MLAAADAGRMGRSAPALFYALACVFANGTKPYINLLWVVLPLMLYAKSEWKARFSRAVVRRADRWRAHWLLTLGVEQYGTLLRHNYGAIARQGGSHRERRCAAAVCAEKSAALYRGFAGHTV